MMLLPDTSIWIDHLRTEDSALSAVLDDGDVLVHPFVIGELGCGNLRRRTEFIGMLSHLPSAPSASDTEALEFIERHHLMGEGLGYVDVHLLTSVALAGGARIWTRDRGLSRVAARLKLAHVPSP